jgi:hypothetical protein
MKITTHLSILACAAVSPILGCADLRHISLDKIAFKVTTSNGN